MALINCPHCNREISEKAPVCPGCGCALRESVPAPPKPERVPSPKGGDHEAPCPGCGKLNWSKPQIKSFSLGGAVTGALLGGVIGLSIEFFIGGSWCTPMGIGGAIGLGFKTGTDTKIIDVTCLSCGHVVRKN